MPEQTAPDMVEARSGRPRATPRAMLETVVIGAVFALYVTFALKLLLVSRAPGSERSFNLVPFASISQYLSSGSPGASRSTFANIAGNVLLFVPLGSVLPVLTRWTVARTMLVVASASVAVEILQGVFALGASDVDDVILNCLGGFLGIQLFVLLEAITRNRDRVRTVAAVMSVVALPALSYLLLHIRLRM